MQKETYESVKLVITEFDKEDVITTSDAKPQGPYETPIFGIPIIPPNV